MNNFLKKMNLDARLVWFFLGLVSFFDGPRLQEVIARKRLRQIDDLSVDDITTPDLDQLLDLHIRINDENNGRQDSLNDKTKNLLTLTVASVPFATYFLGSFPYAFIGLFGLVCLSITIMLLLTYWGLTSKSVISIDRVWYQEHRSNQIKKELIGDWEWTNRSNSFTIDFLADIFAGARRYFIIALVFLISNLVVGHFVGRDADVRKVKQTVQLTIEGIKSDPELANIFRGPPGPLGPEGNPGKDGESCTCPATKTKSKKLK